MTSKSQPQNPTEPNPNEEMLRFISLMIIALVDRPQDVKISADASAFSTTLRVTVASADLGKVIGKQGRTARSLRTLVAAAGIRMQKRFELDIQKQAD